MTELHRAATIGDIDLVLRELAGGSDDLIHKMDDETWQTPLHCACASDMLVCIKVLIEKGADIEAVDLAYKKPIHLARSETALRILLDAGADPNVTSAAGAWAGQILVPLINSLTLRGEIGLAKVLREYGADPMAEPVDGERVLKILDSESPFEFLPERVAQSDSLMVHVRRMSKDLTRSPEEWVALFPGQDLSAILHPPLPDQSLQTWAERAQSILEDLEKVAECIRQYAPPDRTTKLLAVLETRRSKEEHKILLRRRREEYAFSRGWKF
jgi:hypothetical protein